VSPYLKECHLILLIGGLLKGVVILIAIIPTCDHSQQVIDEIYGGICGSNMEVQT